MLLILLRKFVKANWRELGATVAFIAVTITSVFITLERGIDILLTSWLGRVFLVAVIFYAVLQAWSLYRSYDDARLEEKLRQKKKEVASLEEAMDHTHERLLELFSLHLKHVAESELSFGNTERITVYGHDAEEGHFKAVGRYSRNPLFDNPADRYYPDDQGVISQAWQQGKASVEGLPDPATEEEEYVRVQKEDWGIPKGVVRDFSMKSRSLSAYCIRNARGDKAIAVIVFESVQPTLPNKDDVEEFAQSEYWEQISDSVEVIHNYLGSEDVRKVLEGLI